MKHMFNLHIYNDDSINAVNANGKTPLHLAAKYGREGMVKMLLNKKAEVDVVDSRGRTPLHLAAKNNNKVMFNQDQTLQDKIQIILNHNKTITKKKRKKPTPSVQKKELI